MLLYVFPLIGRDGAAYPRCIVDFVDLQQPAGGVRRGCTSWSEDTICSGFLAAVEYTEPNR